MNEKSCPTLKIAEANPFELRNDISSNPMDVFNNNAYLFEGTSNYSSEIDR